MGLRGQSLSKKFFKMFVIGTATKRRSPVKFYFTIFRFCTLTFPSKNTTSGNAAVAQSLFLYTPAKNESE